MVIFDERDWLNKVLHKTNLYLSLYRTHLALAFTTFAIGVASLSIYFFSRDITYLSLPIIFMIGCTINVLLFLAYSRKAILMERISFDILHGEKLENIERRYKKICKMWFEGLLKGEEISPEINPNSLQATSNSRFFLTIKTWINDWKPLLDFIGVILIVISLGIAGWSLTLAVGSLEINKEISEYNKEMMEWYKNPEVNLQTWTSVDGIFKSGGHIQILTYEKTNLTEELGMTEEDMAKEITIWIYNAGRKPFVNAKVSVMFIITDYDMGYPFPFKFFSITTPVNFLIYNNDENATILNDDVKFALSNDTIIRFLPEIDMVPNKIVHPPEMSLGYIGPGEVVSLNLEVFAVKEDYTGYLIVSLYNLDFIEELNPIPLKSV